MWLVQYKREQLHHFYKYVSKKPLKITNTTPNYYTTLDLLSINVGLVYKLNKARFRRRTFHEPNLIRIKADPNYLDRLK